MTFKSRLSLDPQHSLVLKEHRTKGFMGETDIDSYDITDQSGAKVGEVLVEDHTAVKGFARTVHVIQRDASGRVVVDERFDPTR